MNHRSLEKAFVDEMQTMMRRGTRFDLRLNAVEAWTILSNLQLALRHPENTGPGAQVARTIAKHLQSMLADSPILASIAEMGWHPENDQAWTDWPGGQPAKSKKERSS